MTELFENTTCSRCRSSTSTAGWPVSSRRTTSSRCSGNADAEARFKYHILVFFSVLGPGFITAMVDNDAGGIFTYSQAGAKYGYLPLWTLLPITVLLIVTQEMCSRMGAVTGKGLSDLIREEFGLRTTFFMLAALVFVNLTNVMANFAGVASSLELFHVSRYHLRADSCRRRVASIVKTEYNRIEKVFLFATTLYIAYIVSGILVKPDWKEAAIYSVKPVLMLDTGYIAMLIGMVGTSVAPWMQFYPAGGRCRERRHGERVHRVADRGDCRLHRDVGHRVLHHRRLRRRDLVERSHGHQGLGGCGARVETFRPVRLPAVLRGSVERIRFCRLHSSSVDRLHRMRRSGL